MFDFGIIADPFFYAVAIPACLLTGISKGGFGGALGLLGVPLLSLAIHPAQAAAILLPILCAMDIVGLIVYRRQADWRNLAILLPGAIIGIILCYFAWPYLDDDSIRLILGLMAVLFALKAWLLPVPHGRVTGRDPVKGGIAGVICGFTSFVAHAGGPPVQMYLLPQRLDKTLYVGTTVWLFSLINFIKLAPYHSLGLLSAENLGTSLVLAPLAPLGIWLGVRIHAMVPEVLFYRFAWIMLFVTGLKLTWDALAGWGVL